jgi:hypothetical protein
MAKYLVTCECGRQLAVEAGQAGETLRCDCGATIAVPTLRQLRELPIEGEEPVARTRTWEARHGAMTVLLIVAVASLAVAAVKWRNRPAEPVFNPVSWTDHTDRGISELTPVAAWRAYYEAYRPLAAMGFVEFEHPAAQTIEQDIDSRRWMRNVLLSVAVIAFVAILAIGLSSGARPSGTT